MTRYLFKEIFASLVAFGAFQYGGAEARNFELNMTTLVEWLMDDQIEGWYQVTNESNSTAVVSDYKY